MIIKAIIDRDYKEFVIMTLILDEVNEFEPMLINHLEHLGGQKQWEYLPQIKTTAQLWDNFRKILYQLNQDKLTQPLSDTEFNQVKTIINNLKTPYQAGQFLYGLNGVSQVEVDLDDGRHVYLTVFDQSQIGAGNTVYQIVNQIERKAKTPELKNRRFDVTLLINGLPIIQIEEKADRHIANEALEQMRQYIDEGQYSDIFATLQILVAMTPHEIRYIANTTIEQFNTDFAFQWQDEKTNEPITCWREFANKVLSIPMAHQMATNYMILDGTKNHEMIKVMRPYQVYATRHVLDQIHKHEFGYDDQRLGYVWHTTGSGKTITSFKTAWLAATQEPKVDKVVFLVDRIALTNQTVDEYRAYDPSGNQIAATANQFDLGQKLKTKQKGSIIVTSIQKMDRLVSNTKFKAPDKNIVFIVDEAHRSTAGEMLQRIKAAFPKSAWVGYTGTPSFALDGHEGPTTRDIFGDVLHAYTIKDAIKDHNVLGFKVDFETTLSQDELTNHYLPAYFSQMHPTWTEDKIDYHIHHLSPEDMDDMVSSSVYDMNDQHIHLVVKDIVDNWEKRSVNYKYNAILTTHVGGGKASTPMAMKYYNEFKKMNEHRQRPLRVAVTFSQDTSNSDHQFANNTGLEKVILDYNAIFKTNFGAKTVKEYTQDVIARLNKTISLNEDDYLDLVIVVDQLLTGFNAPKLNTLYVDRTLRGANLIQAYSRTNRVYDMQSKPFGHIVNYRWPANAKKIMQAALAIYADRNSASVQTDLELNQDDGVLAKPYDELLNDLEPVMMQLADMTENFTHVPDSQDRCENMYHLLRKHDSLMAQIKQSDEYDPHHPEQVFAQSAFNEEDEAKLSSSIKYALKKQLAVYHQVDISDINLQMEHYDDITVTYDYLMELLAKLANQIHDNQMAAAQATKEKIAQIAPQMNDAKYIEQVNQFSDKLFNKKISPQYPVQPAQIKDLIAQHDHDACRRYILNFKEQWGLYDIADSRVINEIINQHTVGMDDLNDTGAVDIILKEGQAVYHTDANDEAVRQMSKIRYRTHLRKALLETADYVKKNFN